MQGLDIYEGYASSYIKIGLGTYSIYRYAVTIAKSDAKLGFFEATPVVKPTGVAVTAVGIHAALVSLGLIAA